MELPAHCSERRRPRPGDKWFLDEVLIRIRGEQHYLWRAIDQDGQMLDILVQSRRNTESGQALLSQGAGWVAVRPMGNPSPTN
jgi:putative transposase